MVDRAKMERDARRKLGTLSREHLAELSRLLGDPPNPSRVPPAFWARVEREHRQTLSGILLLAFMSSADEWGADGEMPGAQWADRQADMTSARYVHTAQSRLDQLGADWTAEAPLSGELRHGLSGIFGADRDSTVSGTEITRGLGAGVVYAAQSSPEYAEGRIRIMWRLGPREKHCPVCKRLADTDETVWQLEVSSPPIHPRCGCFLELIRI